MSDKFTDAVCRVAAEFGLPVNKLLARELRPVFANRIAAATCLELLVKEPVCCLSSDRLHLVFRMVLREFGWNERELLAQQFRLDYLRRIVLGLAVECSGSPETAARDLSIRLRVARAAHAAFESEAQGNSDYALHLQRLRKLARGQRSTEENQSDAVKGEVRPPSVLTK